MRIYNKQDSKTYDIPDMNTLSSPLVTTMKNTEVLENVNDLQWKQSNPMEQLTGTFHPETINDMQEWYCTSPLIVEDGLDIVSKRYNEI